MMIKNILTRATLLLALAVMASSCLRDDLPPCPALTLTLEVKDKNYSNIDDVLAYEDRRAEDLAFREYIPTLFYRLADAETGAIVAESRLDGIADGSQALTIAMDPELPFGKYVFTAWGGIDSAQAEELAKDHSKLDLHYTGTTGRDIYFTRDVIEYTVKDYDHTVEMERVKGKLVIETIDAPSHFGAAADKVEKVAGRFHDTYKYTLSTELSMYNEWTEPQRLVHKSIVAPSAEGGNSRLSRGFYGPSRADEPLYAAAPVELKMERNKVSVVRYVWDGNAFLIYILIDASWKQVNNLTFDD